jgi:sulfate adenylyltransferase subunit 2
MAPLPYRCDEDQALKQALDKYKFDAAAFGGARRDEEKSRAKERIFSFRSASIAGIPKNQRPETLESLQHPHPRGESIRVFPLSNWTELDIWQYIRREKHRNRAALLQRRTPGGERDGMLIMVDDDRMPEEPTAKTVDPEIRPVPHARLLPADRRVESDSRHCSTTSSRRCC